MLEKLISGGQTGVDRAALDVAMDNNFPCGGFCPKGRIAEDGKINCKYPLQEHISKHYAERTLANVLSSDGTLVFYNQILKGGTALTVQFCKENDKPFCMISAQQYNTKDTSEVILDFINQHKIKSLNVAGPRKSQWQNGYQYTYSCLNKLMECIK